MPLDIRNFLILTLIKQNLYINPYLDIINRWTCSNFEKWEVLGMNSKKYLFTWDEISDNDKLIDHLLFNYGIQWIKKGNINRSENEITIEDKTNTLSLHLDTENKKVELKQNGTLIDEFSAVFDKENKWEIFGNESLREGPGNSPVKMPYIIIISIYLLSFFFFLLYYLIQFWPSTSGASELGEQRFIVLIAIAGALGGLVHSIRSFYWYVGNRALVWSWVLQYFMLPFVGSAMGIVFYLVIRGGLFSSNSNINESNPLIFIAISALVGLFSVAAALKLENIAWSLFTKPGGGSESVPQGRNKYDTKK
jgi:hypothetical protein